MSALGLGRSVVSVTAVNDLSSSVLQSEWSGSRAALLFRGRGYAYVQPVPESSDGTVHGECDRWRVFPRNQVAEIDGSDYALNCEVTDDFLRFRECPLLEACTVFARAGNTRALRVQCF